VKIQNYDHVEGKEEAPGLVGRVVIGPGEGAPNFAMRVLEIQPRNSSPYHAHAWEHEIFVLSGRGVIKSAEVEKYLSEGDAILVNPNEQHCLINTGDSLLRYICVSPLIDGKLPVVPGALR